jgi:TonB family protein
MSDSESDPFAPGMSVDFRDGRVDARLGRKVKTVRPKLSLASRYDLQGSLYPSMKVRVQIDAEGVVRKVDILKSSGSVGADQSVEVALYQWWFEPIKDKAGHAIASELTFPIVWR